MGFLYEKGRGLNRRQVYGGRIVNANVGQKLPDTLVPKSTAETLVH